jgi:hypothetical protein
VTQRLGQELAIVKLVHLPSLSNRLTSDQGGWRHGSAKESECASETTGQGLNGNEAMTFIELAAASDKLLVESGLLPKA